MTRAVNAIIDELPNVRLDPGVRTASAARSDDAHPTVHRRHLRLTEPPRPRETHREVRPHHRRRRFGRLRSGQSPVRGPSRKVLLLEAGPRDKNPMIKIPKGFGKLLGDQDYAWFFPTDPFGPTGRVEFWVRGKTLGGSSAVNGLVYNRGSAADWDAMAAAGNGPDWTWENILPHYKAIENNQLGGSTTRGRADRSASPGFPSPTRSPKPSSPPARP